MKNIKAQIFSLSLFLLFFILVSYFVQKNISLIKLFFESHSSFWGMFFYSFFGFVATVFAPVSSIPLVPVASNLWGWKITGFLNILGWGIGSLVAFFIARKFGKPVVKRFVSLKRLEEFENKIPKENIFISIVILRILVPVDLLSYALGLFSNVSFLTYALATFIGISPFAFFFAYAGALSLKDQILFLSFALSIFALLVFWKNVILKDKN